MIIKLILLAVVIYGVYFFFFKKPNMLKKSSHEEIDTAVECAQCGVYVSAKEAILKDGKNYCSHECARLK